jgi:hypothetical protein
MSYLFLVGKLESLNIGTFNLPTFQPSNLLVTTPEQITKNIEVFVNPAD